MSESELKAIWKALAEMQARVDQLFIHKNGQVEENKAVFNRMNEMQIVINELRNYLAETRMKLSKIESHLFHFPKSQTLVTEL